MCWCARLHIRVRMLLHMHIRVRMLLHMRSLAMIHISACYYISDVLYYYISTMYLASAYSYMCVRGLLCMCPHTPTYLASSRSNKRVLVLLYTCPHTPTRRHHPAHRARAMRARLQLGKAPQPHRNIFSKLKKKKPACGSKRTS